MVFTSGNEAEQATFNNPPCTIPPPNELILKWLMKDQMKSI
ncbi:hypothetical protein JCM19231_2264 [Vibrio ishigakensis]|uniref:Uncharacterized protein n=1 Tax=Vibrio ishigakensis TaxID=1481914 RepID=A0A0B8NI58_9VIBR|nr:hypothetical protein JCM19231_2264 [Vibrio ishigakensis]